MSTGAITWPPENPTATTPSSLPAERNLGEIVEGEVIIVSLENDTCCEVLLAGNKVIRGR